MENQQQQRRRSASDWRRLYKRGMERQQKAMEQERQERIARRAEAPRFNIQDCSRCLLQSRGIIMIPDHCICTCQIQLPNEKVTIDEVDVKIDECDSVEECYIDVLVTSVTLGSIKEAPALYQNVPPTDVIKARTVEVEPTFLKYNNEHKCEQALTVYDEQKDQLSVHGAPYLTADWMGNECRQTLATRKSTVSDVSATATVPTQPAQR